MLRRRSPDTARVPPLGVRHPLETAPEGSRPVLHVDGRLDAEWSAHLEDNLRQLLRSGRRSVVVDLSRVSFVSSAGIGVLTRCAREFIALRGELFVGDPPPAVVEGLGVAGLGEWIVHPTGEGSDRRLRVSGSRDLRHTRDWRAPATPVSGGSFEVSVREPDATLRCRVHGPPLIVGQKPYDDAGYRVVSFEEPVFGIGIGALGTSVDDGHARSGELLGAGGAVIHLPTDGAGIPDHLGSLPSQAASAVLLSGLTCDGDFSHLVRFGPARHDASVPISEAAEVCLEATGATAAGVVMVVEVNGLIAAYLRRSPSLVTSAATNARSLREWLTITSEPSYPGTTALIVGVIARRTEPLLASHLRPLRSDHALLGHLHAAVFSYRPVPQRTVTVREVVQRLLGEQELRAVLHLLRDDRDHGGIGESTFVRGLAWTAPIATIAPDEA